MQRILPTIFQGSEGIPDMTMLLEQRIIQQKFATWRRTEIYSVCFYLSTSSCQPINDLQPVMTTTEFTLSKPVGV